MINVSFKDEQVDFLVVQLQGCKEQITNNRFKDGVEEKIDEILMLLGGLWCND